MSTSVSDAIRSQFSQFVVPSYARFDLVLERGEGSYLWDGDGKRYLDFGGGIAVCALGHANPEIADALNEQARKLVHISNLYYNELQGRLAQKIVDLIAPGRVFFCNSGAEANEGLYKLARKVGHDSGRYEIITTVGSFHGRTLAGIAATGQEKVKKGFEPAVEGFKHVPFNDLDAMRDAVGDKTIAILVEPIQGESGITMATTDYLLGLRRLCDERDLLLLFDEVQAGHFRTGNFQSWQTIVGVASAAGRCSGEDHRRAADATIIPDGVSMAKALGGGFPMGAFWVAEKWGDVLSAGTHASTFGGTPLACAVALKILEIIERDDLAGNARRIGEFISRKLLASKLNYPAILKDVRGAGLIIGVEFQPQFAASDIVKRLHAKGLLTIPAAASVIRLLPALNLSRNEAEEGLRIIESVIAELAGEQKD